MVFPLTTHTRTPHTHTHLTHTGIATHFVRSPSSMNASIGTTVVLRCEPPYSNPAPLIQWKKDGAVLPTDSRITILPTGNLYILNVTEADSGDYQCMATNLVSGARRRSEMATLTITGVCVCVCNEGGGGGEGRWLES